MFIFDLYTLRSSALLFAHLQAKSSSGCHPHIHLVKEEERCIADLLLYKSERATGEFIVSKLWIFHLLC